MSADYSDYFVVDEATNRLLVAIREKFINQYNDDVNFKINHKNIDSLIDDACGVGFAVGRDVTVNELQKRLIEMCMDVKEKMGLDFALKELWWKVTGELITA